MDPASADSPLTLDPVFEWLYIDDDEADPDEEVVQVVVDVEAEDERSVPWGTYAAPRHLAGKHDQSTHGHGHGKVGGMGEMARGTDQTEWAAGQTRNGHDVHGLSSGELGDPRDNALMTIAKRQGFDGKPTVGSIEDTVKAGGIELHRGVVDFKGRQDFPARPADELVKDFKSGSYEPGTGLYGNGYYFSKSKRVGNYYADWDKKRKGATIRAALKPGAKVADYDHLQGEMKAWKAEVRPKTQDLVDLYSSDFKTPDHLYSPHFVDYVMAEPGRFAAMKGYDAIKVVGKQDGAPPVKGEPTATRPGGRKKWSAHDQYVILNRTALVIEEG